jgi:hypothetical protein
MPFDLTITFTGLTLFVPDRDRIFALLPSTPPDMPHRAEIRIDPKYLPADPSRELVGPYTRSLDGWSLDLTGLMGNSGVVALPPGLADAGAAAGKPISRRLLGPDPGEIVTARVALPPATEMTRAPGGFWDLGRQMDVEMTHKVEWTLTGVQADSLNWGLLNLRDFAAEPLPELNPVDGRIVLEVHHLPDGDFPGDPPCQSRGDHFGLYYQLFGVPADGRPFPLFRAPPLEHMCADCWGTHAVVRIRQEDFGSFYTCMMAMSLTAGE